MSNSKVALKAHFNPIKEALLHPGPIYDIKSDFDRIAEQKPRVYTEMSPRRTVPTTPRYSARNDDRKVFSPDRLREHMNSIEGQTRSYHKRIED